MQFQHIRRLRIFVYNILQNDEHDTLFSRYVDYFLIFLIMTNVAAVIAESVDRWYYPYQNYFTWFENFSIVVFSIEYLLRLWSVAEAKPDNTTWRQRWQWLKSPSALIDLVAIVPAFLNFFVTIDLRFLRILRLFRILKLTRYFASMRILLVVISKEKGSFQAVIFILIIMIVTASSGIYLVENHAQPEEFESIPKAMWWAVVTLTTVGYGDVIPITNAGKILGAIITILGVGLAALPAGILATGLANELNQRREELEQHFREQLVDSDFDLVQNQMMVEKIRRELGLDKEQAQNIVLQVLREQELERREREVETRQKNFCPHCGEAL
ncbi:MULTISPECIES: ion transporter [Psychrobacter]|jgi:voltage-gated potassium channel|uniref:Potassium voltage gated channel, Shab-related subfamily, member 2 n=1 Tax=Psychrobacter glaciei TaxID=619771 RepID=A0ABQ3GQI2_9GAMM|nr:MULTISPECIES: ion transporter [Psychrobacter]MBP3944941.1 ion transporter [Psychrobacter sp. K31L]MCH1782094.1 ion transporter [Psychrobacter glaciei]GHD27696.1 potassium voltage gated channel, Shab-related subfamily, member 2 [Psychrobacter glaciei]